MSGNLSKLKSPSRSAATRGAKGRNWVLAAAVVAGASLLGADRAQAGFSSIGESITASEADHEAVLERTYGGDFVQNGNDFSNGTVTVSRIDDGSDQVWNGNVVSARAVGLFSSKRQAFGTVGSDGQFNQLFEVEGRNFDVTGSVDTSSAALANLSNSGIVFARGGSRPMHSSVDSGNGDGRDHLVSYSVSGLTGAPNTNTFLLFWEDAPNRRGDFDYNDLVVEVKAAGEALLIPLPAAAWSGLTGLLGLGLVSGLRKARRRLA